MNVFRNQGCRDRLNAAEIDHSKKVQYTLDEKNCITYWAFKIISTCFSSLIACLQAHVLRTGFVELCESTRNNISTEALLTDVYDGVNWNQFSTVENTPLFIAEE